MSKYVDEILKDLKDNPETFKDYEGQGVEKGNIIICLYGNTRVVSIIDVYINGKNMPTSYIDLWRLETAIKYWYRNISLSILIT